MREDAGRGWRRVVPSPEPGRDRRARGDRDLVDGGVLVVCNGGGGVPVVRSRGALHGIDAVIDKDLAAALLAKELGADALLILTDVPQAYVALQDARAARSLARVTVEEMERHTAAGEFKAGSMGPKVAAALRRAAGAKKAAGHKTKPFARAGARRAPTAFACPASSSRTRPGCSGRSAPTTGASPPARAARLGRGGHGDRPVRAGDSSAPTPTSSPTPAPCCPPTVRVVELASDDAWMRDCGPTFVVDDEGDVRLVDWLFNAWGGLYDGLYFPWDRDQLVPQGGRDRRRRALRRAARDRGRLDPRRRPGDGDHHRGVPALAPAATRSSTAPRSRRTCATT
jgi:hypothetical protein